MTKRLSPNPDLEALVQSLNEQADQTPATPSRDERAEPLQEVAAARWSIIEPRAENFSQLEAILRAARASHASDLLLVSGSVPIVRCNGELRPTSFDPLTPEACEALCAALVPEERRGELTTRGAADFSLRSRESGVLRANVHRERGFWAASIRLLPDAAPEIDRLNLPEELGKLAALKHGLILVTGPTGCGKSTTLAAIMRRIIETRRCHVITIEDPVEYEHHHRESLVEHIEVGRDIESYPVALRSILRQDPDVILIGEMRDAESMSIAISAAETGHLVLATLHTADSAQSIHRILDSYPAVQQDAIRAQLSVSIVAIVSQQLIPRTDGEGRVPAVEILRGTPAVRNIIRVGRIEQLRSQLTLEQSAGMIDLDRSLARLVRGGLIDLGEAKMRARSPETLANFLRNEP